MIYMLDREWPNPCSTLTAYPIKSSAHGIRHHRQQHLVKRSRLIHFEFLLPANQRRGRNERETEKIEVLFIMDMILLIILSFNAVFLRSRESQLTSTQ